MRPTTRSSHACDRAALVLAACVLALTPFAAAPVALAQTGLATDVVRAVQLSAPQRQTLDRFVQDHAADLTSDEADERRSGRTALLEPLRDTQVSVEFRLAYSDALIDALRQAAGSGQLASSVGALHLAGSLGTDAGARLCEDTLADPSPALRYAAAEGLGACLETLTGSAPALAPIRAEQIVQNLTDRIQRENHAHVMDRLTRSALRAAANTNPRFPDLANPSLRGTCEALSMQVQRNPSAAVLPSAVRALAAARDAFLRGDRSMDEQTALAAATLAGDALSVSRAVALEDLDEERTALLSSLYSVSEAVVIFASSQRGGPDLQSQGCASNLEQGDAEGYARCLDAWIGTEGALTEAPFTLPANRFR